VRRARLRLRPRTGRGEGGAGTGYLLPSSTNQKDCHSRAKQRSPSSRILTNMGGPPPPPKRSWPRHLRRYSRSTEKLAWMLQRKIDETHKSTVLANRPSTNREAIQRVRRRRRTALRIWDHYFPENAGSEERRKNGPKRESSGATRRGTTGGK